MHWVVDDGDTPSPDCDDNALAGDVHKGDKFPTGHIAPPISPTCRCIVAARALIRCRRSSTNRRGPRIRRGWLSPRLPPMRAQADMPRRRRRTSGRGRVAHRRRRGGAVPPVHVAAGRGRLLHRLPLVRQPRPDARCGSGILGAKIALGVIFTAAFFVLCFVNLTVADRTAPAFRPPGPEDELLSRYHDLVDRRAWLVRGGVSLLFGLIAGVGVSAEWNQWILFTHAKAFGIKDATFHTDVGFYVFRLPFYQSVVQWLFASLIIILLITRGGRLPQRRHPAADADAAGHPAGQGPPLGAAGPAGAGQGGRLLAGQRYAAHVLDPGRRSTAPPTPTCKAQLPALNLLMFIALLSCGLFIYNIWRRGWVLPVMAVGLWALVALVAGTAYPAFVQRFQVLPTESSKEAPYIDHNIAATRQALNIDRRRDPARSTTDADRRDDQQGDRGQPGHGAEHPPARPDHRHATRTRSSSRTSATRRSTTSTSTATRSPTPDGAVGARPQVVLSTRDLTWPTSRRSRGRASTSPTPTATAWPCRRPTR